MNDFHGEILNNEEICEGAFLLEVGFDARLPRVSGGQFAMLEVPRDDCVLRRPLGICMADDGYAAFLYQLKGKGTHSMSCLQPGDGVRVLMPLGNGFPIGDYKNVAIVGGGFGIAPLYITAAQCGGNVRIYNGFSSKKQIMLEKQFSAVGELTVCTDDGSKGFHGFPTQALEKDMLNGFEPDAIFCCGPDPLMRAVKRLGEERGIDTFVSLEAHMGCGVGACLTCTCKVAGHNKRVCNDGPVFRSTEVFE